MYEALLTYVKWLIDVNQAEKGDLSAYEVCFQFGVLSEVYEAKALVYKYDEYDRLLSEAGDILAYATLALFTMGESPEQMAARFSNLNAFAPNDEPIIARYTDNLSKFYRGDVDKDIRYTNAKTDIYNLVYWASSISGVNSHVLAYFNRQKLEARLANVGTFRGSGDR